MKTSRKRLGTWAVSLLALGAACAASAVNYPVGTFIIHGLAKSEKNLALGLVADDEALRMQAVATNGTVLAECPFSAPVSANDPENFALEVPLTLKATARSAAVGDSVRLCLVKDGMPKAALSELICLYGECGTKKLVAQVYETVSYTNVNGQVAVLPADYVRGLGTYFPGKDPLAAYDPFADYDNDGASNYFEYRAATNPFVKTDRLRIRAFQRSAERDAVTFEYVGGVVYGISASPSLESDKASWTERDVATEASASPGAKRVMAGASVSEAGLKTFYLLPTEKASSMFYKLEVK